MSKNLKYFAFIALVIFLDCTPNFENNTRILAKGIIQDQNTVPIADAKVSVYTRRPNGFFIFSQNEYLLGQNLSQSDGAFEVTSIFDKDPDFSIEINAGDAYTKYVYKTDTEDYTPANLVFNLGTVQLKQLGNVNYNITRTSGNGNTLRFSFKFVNDLCIEVFEEGILDPLQSFCFEENYNGRTLNDTNPDIVSSFKTPYGTVVEFTYSINDQPDVTETFTIDQENYDFTFNY
jgi:hypothetical protein